MEKITAIQVLDVPVHPYSMDAAVQYLDDKIQEQKHSFVVTANAEIIMMCQDDAEYKNILTNVADLVLPDGAGTVWAGRQLRSCPLCSPFYLPLSQIRCSPP